jgi:transcriptional regulator GlxA family with amidase domain
VIHGLDDVGIALRGAVTSALRRCTATRAMRELAPHVPAALRPLLRFCLEEAERAPTVEDVARALGVHRKTLVNRLRDASMPGPSALLGWCRLVIAAQLLEDPERPVEQVAYALNFPSAAAFRNMLRRYTGLAPGEVRINGGLNCVLHAFRRSVGGLRAGRLRVRGPVRQG